MFWTLLLVLPSHVALVLVYFPCSFTPQFLSWSLFHWFRRFPRSLSTFFSQAFTHSWSAASFSTRTFLHSTLSNPSTLAFTHSWSAASFSSRTLLFRDITLEPSPTQCFLFLVDDDNLISFQNCFGFIAWIQSNCRFVNLTSCTAAKFIASSSECSQSIRGRIKPSRFIKKKKQSRRGWKIKRFTE